MKLMPGLILSDAEAPNLKETAMYKLNLLALRRLMVFILIVVMAMDISSCGGGETTTSLTPGRTADEQVATISVFDLSNSADFDRNGIAVTVKFEGVPETDAENSSAKKQDDLPTYDVGDDLQFQYSPYVLGYGFVMQSLTTQSGSGQAATRGDIPITDLKSTKGADRNLCSMTMKVATLPELVSDLSVLREMDESIDVSSLQQEEDVTVDFSCTVYVNPYVGANITAERLGFTDIPAERETIIRRDNPAGLAFGLLGLALSLFAPGAEAVVLCGDPGTTLYGHLLIAGRHGNVVVPTTHTLVTSITPATTTITISDMFQFADSVWFDGIVVNGGASCTWSVVSGPGSINSSSGLYTATTETGTATIKVVCAYNGLTATDTATVIVTAPTLPPGLTLDGKPFDLSKLNKILTPEDVSIDVLTKDTQQLGPVLSYENQENTIDKRWYYIESWEAGAGAPTGSISIGGLWRGVISGNGTFDPGAWVVILTEPINTRVYVTTEITVTGN